MDSEVVALGMRLESNNLRISWQNPCNSATNLDLKDLINGKCFDPFYSSFNSILERALKAVLIGPTLLKRLPKNKNVTNFYKPYTINFFLQKKILNWS